MGPSRFQNPQTTASPATRTPAMVPVSFVAVPVGCVWQRFMHESFMDEMLPSAGVDPLQERLRCAGTSLAPGLWNAWRDVGVGAAIWGRTAGGGWPLPGYLACRWPAWSRSPHSDGIRIRQSLCLPPDVGRVLDPVNFERRKLARRRDLGLGHAMNCELTYRDAWQRQDNYHMYEACGCIRPRRLWCAGLRMADKIRGSANPPWPLPRRLGQCDLCRHRAA